MSMLEGILSRLNQMKNGNEDSERYFELNGKRICKVNYYAKTDMFEVSIYKKDGKTDVYSFDNIDMAAIEIFDLLQT